MKRVILLFFVVLLYTNVNAQRKGTGNDNMPKDGVLKGRIIDSESNEGIPAASVYLYQLKDSSLASGAIAGNGGQFEIKELGYGKYFMKLSFIGYSDKLIDGISITPKAPNVDLGNLEISMADISIGGIEVTGERTRVDYRVDKKIVSVSNDIISSGGSAVTVLENVPSVEVDVEGNVSLRGSSSFRVFINGKPTVLDASDALEQIPASTIDNIEIITNPSAKYDPEGIGGIINVITKRDKSGGFSGNVELSAGTLDNYKISGLFNYNYNGLNVFAGLNYNDFNRRADGESIQETYFADDATNYVEYDTKRRMNRLGQDLKFGLSYDFTDKTGLSFEGTLGNMVFERGYKSDVYNLNRYDSTIYSNNNSLITRDDDFFALYFDFIHKFNKNGHNITSSLYYTSRDGFSKDRQDKSLTSQDFSEIIELADKNRSFNNTTNEEIRFKLDYTFPISDNRKFEAGFQQSLEPKSDRYILERYNIEDDIWVNDEMYSNFNEFDRNISAVYTTYSDYLYGFSYMIGLRGEYTDRSIKVIETDKDYTIDRLDFFPSLHISNQINEKNQIYLSYSKRLQRPWMRFLDPNPTFRDEFNYYQGNPELEPEYINSYELGYQRYFTRSYISTELFYRNTTNIINRVMEIDENDMIKRTAENLDQDHSVGVEIVGDLTLTNKFSINTSVNMFYYKLEGNLLSEIVDEETFVWSGRINGMYRFSKSTSLQANMFYRSKSVTAQGTRADMWGVNLGARQAFLDNNLVFSLNFRDVFATFKHEMELFQPNFYSFDTRSPYSPIITLSVSYKFNNFRKKAKIDEAGEEMDLDF